MSMFQDIHNENSVKEQREKNYISFNEINNIEMVSSKIVRKKIIEFINMISIVINISYRDFMFLFGLTKGKYTKEQNEGFFKYISLKEDFEKKLFFEEYKNLDESIIEDIKKEKERIATGLKNLPSSLLDLLLSDDDQIYDKLVEILVFANKNNKTKEHFENSDTQVLIELFIRIFKKPQQDFDAALFLNLGMMKLKEIILSLPFIQNVKKAFWKENKPESPNLQTMEV